MFEEIVSHSTFFFNRARIKLYRQDFFLPSANYNFNSATRSNGAKIPKSPADPQNGR